jgi:hypothetical protein
MTSAAAAQGSARLCFTRKLSHRILNHIISRSVNHLPERMGSDKIWMRAGSGTSGRLSEGSVLTETDKTWLTLRQVVDRVRGAYPNISVREICDALEGRCASGRIRARGRRRIYSFDRFPNISHTDPEFVYCSEAYSYIKPAPEPIPKGEWRRDLAFFVRPLLKPGEDYLTGLERAFEQSDAPVELRSKSKNRLAWLDVEFSREDVTPDAEDEAPLEAVKKETHRGVFANRGGGSSEPGLPIGRTAPVAERELRSWYRKRVLELTTRGETSSGEEDWEAAKQEFPGRATRARLRAMREEHAPGPWKQQGRRSALRGN